MELKDRNVQNAGRIRLKNTDNSLFGTFYIESYEDTVYEAGTALNKTNLNKWLTDAISENNVVLNNAITTAVQGKLSASLTGTTLILTSN